MRIKSTCCKKYRKKGKACRNCPKVAGLSQKARRKKLKKLVRKRH